MQKFFRGWKRKLGVVTLILACVFAAGWVRSLIVIDEMSFYIAGRDHGFGSALGLIAWRSIDNHAQNPSIRWITETIKGSGHTAESLVTQFESSFYLQKSLHPTQFIATYWSIVVPLTFLSAWLLLSKPPATNPKPASEP